MRLLTTYPPCTIRAEMLCDMTNQTSLLFMFVFKDSIKDQNESEDDIMNQDWWRAKRSPLGSIWESRVLSNGLGIIVYKTYVLSWARLFLTYRPRSVRSISCSVVLLSCAIVRLALSPSSGSVLHHMNGLVDARWRGEILLAGPSMILPKIGFRSLSCR